MVFHGSGNKKNIAGVSLDDQNTARLPVLSTKEFNFNKGYATMKSTKGSRIFSQFILSVLTLALITNNCIANAFASMRNQTGKVSI